MDETITVTEMEKGVIPKSLMSKMGSMDQILHMNHSGLPPFF